jgi:hypothetical protein
MTNFEKWKENLTLKTLSLRIYNCCILCPCRSAGPCAETMYTCREAVMLWGEQEAQDD